MTGGIGVEVLREGRYKLVSQLGEGGMATVYRARDTMLHVHRAIKVLAPRLAVHAVARERFLGEARIMAGLRHPNIVALHDVGVEGDLAYLVMEEMEGGSLGGRLVTHGPLPPRDAARLMVPVLRALGYAHSQGVVHRDVKPDNVLLTAEGIPKLSDFGIARAETEERRSLTRTGMMMGSLGFMAPEQRTDAKRATALADVFAAGATVYMLVTAREPYDLYSEGLRDRVYAGVPAELAAVIQVACAYDPAHRFPDAATFADALEKLAGQLPQRAAPRPAEPEPVETLAPQVAAEGTWRPDASAPPRPAAASELEVGYVDDLLPPVTVDVKGGVPLADSGRPTRADFKPRNKGVLAVVAGVVAVVVAAVLAWPDGAVAPEGEVGEAPVEEAAPSAVSEALRSLQDREPATPAEPHEEAAPSPAGNPGAAASTTKRSESPAVREPADSQPKVTKAEPEPELVAKPEPAADPVGFVYISTIPGNGKVAIDDGPLEPVPVLARELSIGLHQVRFVGPGGSPVTRSVVVREGQDTRTCWNFREEDMC